MVPVMDGAWSDIWPQNSVLMNSGRRSFCYESKTISSDISSPANCLVVKSNPVRPGSTEHNPLLRFAQTSVPGKEKLQSLDMAVYICRALCYWIVAQP